MTNLEAMRLLVGKVEEVELGVALVQMALSLAGAVDEDPANASLWREYRAVESALRGLSNGDDAGGDVIRRLSAVGDFKDAVA